MTLKIIFNIIEDKNEYNSFAFICEVRFCAKLQMGSNNRISAKE